MGKKSLCILCSIVFLLYGCAGNINKQDSVQRDSAAQSSTKSQLCVSSQWPHENSDLLPDPALRYGRLESGLRYIIKKNSNPRNRVALYLDVQAGSLHEKEEERGYAHFLEHMLFNGTKNFPPGELIKFFQEAGMSFGSDTNAHTGYAETVYKIFLPDGDGESLKNGLRVLSDFAVNALLLEDEVQRERGVIIAEKLSRDSALYRMRMKARENALHGLLLASRQPIGTDETLLKADSAGLNNFYRTWYRPDNMVVVVVGDVDEDDVEQHIKQAFVSVKGRSASPHCLDLGNVESTGLRTFYAYEPEAGKTWVTISSYWNKAAENDSYTLQTRLLKEYAASEIFEKRLKKIAEGSTGLFANPHVSAGEQFDRVGYATISVTTENDKWSESLSSLENTLRQILSYGVTESELEREKKEIISYYKSQAATSDTRKSKNIARRIIWNINNNRVYQSPAQELELYLSAVQAITVEDINAVLRNLWQHGDRLIEVKGSAILPVDRAEGEIAAVYNDAKEIAVTPYSHDENNVFPYLKPASPPVAPVKHSYYQNIDSDIYSYENGVTLNLKRTVFEKNRVNVAIKFGPGKQNEKKPGMATLAKTVINSSGTGRLSKSQLNDALAGTTVDLNFNVESSTFSLSGYSLSSEIELLLQGLYNLLRDPGIREEVFNKKIVQLNQKYKAMEGNVRGAEALYIDTFLAGGSSLYSMPSWDELENITLAELRRWILPYFNESALEITAVGDIDTKKVLQLVNKYFGSLPKRNSVTPSKKEIVFPKGQTFEKTIDTALDKSVLVLSWQTEGFTSIERIRRLNMLASVLEERIRIAIRESLGASYSPDVYHTASRIVNDFGYIKARMILNPEDIAKVKAAVMKICEDLVRDGVSNEELRRVKEPLITSLRDVVRTNGYWQRVLERSSVYEDQLVWPSTVISDNQSIGADELSKMAAEYLHPDETTSAVIRPK